MVTSKEALTPSGATPATPAINANGLGSLLFGNRFRPGLIRQTITYGLLLFMALLFLLPFYWMLNTALKAPQQVFTLPPTWYPNPIQWSNFAQSMVTQYESTPPVYVYAWNTIIITVNGVIATLISSAMVAYAFARLEFPGKNVLFLGILSTLMIPFAVVMVPQFIIWKNLDWLDTLWPLTIPHWFASAWNIFLLRQFFMGIPKEFDESALMDGASRWAIFWGSTIGAVVGNAAMLFLVVAVKDSLPENLQDNIFIKWGGIPIIILIIVFLERRYSAMKRAFEAQKAPQSAPTDPT